MKRRFVLWRFVAFIILFTGACTMVLPFLWMLSTSLKEATLVYTIPPQWIPRPVDWRNYAELFKVSNVVRGFINSVFVTGTVVFLNVFTSSLSAFAFAKLNFPGKRIIFMLLLSTLMVPVVVLLVPQFVVYSRIGWINTLLPMIVPWSLCYPNNIFFLRQYLIGLPSGYLDAARIDGCSYFGAYRRIFLPLSKPALITNGIMLFMESWNDYIRPLIFTHSESKQTIQVAIAMLSSHYEQQTDVPLVMAASLIAIMPMIILFATCQKYFTESFAMTGIKG